MIWHTRDRKREKLRIAVRRGEIKHILMVRAQKIGDMLAFLPGILSIRHHFPDSKITIACRRSGLPIAERIPFASTVDIDDLYRHGLKDLEPVDLLIPSSGDPEWIRLKSRLDIPFAIPSLPDTLAGICLKHRLQFRFLFDDIVRYSTDTHEVERNLKLQEPFGSAPDLERTLWTTEEEIRRARRLISCGDSPKILFSPVGSRPLKNWAPENFAKLADLLSRRQNATLFFGGKGEVAERQINAIVSHMSTTPISLINKASIGELAVLIAETDLLITVDSGPLHIAAYLNRPCIALYGPDTFDQWGPWHRDMTLVRTFRASCQCAPEDDECGQPEHCMNQIHPEDVFDVAVELLATANGSSAPESIRDPIG